MSVDTPIRPQKMLNEKMMRGWRDRLSSLLSLSPPGRRDIGTTRAVEKEEEEEDGGAGGCNNNTRTGRRWPGSNKTGRTRTNGVLIYSVFCPPVRVERKIRRGNKGDKFFFLPNFLLLSVRECLDRLFNWPVFFPEKSNARLVFIGPFRNNNNAKETTEKERESGMRLDTNPSRNE